MHMEDWVCTEQSSSEHRLVWLIVCCAVQGLGGGGVMQLVMIIISDVFC